MKLTKLSEVETTANELQRIKAQIATKTAAANRQISEIRDEVVTQLGDLEEQAVRLEAAIQRFAEDNRDDEDLFAGGKKSIDLTGCTIGFKLGKPSIVLKDGWTEADVVGELQSARMHSYVTKKEEVKLDKSALMKAYNADKLTDKDLKGLGLQLKQEESFFIELKTIDKVKSTAKASA